MILQASLTYTIGYIIYYILGILDYNFILCWIDLSFKQIQGVLHKYKYSGPQFKLLETTKTQFFYFYVLFDLFTFSVQ